MPEINPAQMGGTMRLGGKETTFKPMNDGSDSQTFLLYGKKPVIRERHRHRYEVNPDYIDQLSKSGLNFVGTGDNDTRMEIIELSPKDHPYFVGTQFHPEFLSHPDNASPVFIGLLEAGEKYKNRNN